MNKEQISLNIEEQLLKDLNNLIPNDLCYNTTSSKIETLITMSVTNYANAFRNMVDKFTYLETCYIAQAFNGFYPALHLGINNTSKYLYLEVSDFYKLGSQGFYSDEDIDVDKLLDKLSKLSDYEALVVLNSIYKFWNQENIEEKFDIKDLAIVCNK